MNSNAELEDVFREGLEGIANGVLHPETVALADAESRGETAKKEGTRRLDEGAVERRVASRAQNTTSAGHSATSKRDEGELKSGRVVSKSGQLAISISQRKK